MKESSLRSRLNRLHSSGELGAPQNPAQAKATPPLKQEFLFPGEEEEARTTAGCCYLRQLRFSLEDMHGNSPLKSLVNTRGADLALPGKDPAFNCLNPERALFLDTETTGLAGGTGTYAFLIGLGWVEEDSFVLRQYFLRHPREEKGMLLHFTHWAGTFTDLITFNGKAFDLPLIWTRQVLAGLATTEPERHLDLLHCARRLWKDRLPSRSLRSLEEELLGLKRYGDIPGEEIPAVYFNYLRRGDTERLRDVFQHNVLDILSMATLTAKVAGTAAGTALACHADYYALGKLHAEAGAGEKAEEYLLKASCCGDERLEQASLLYLSLMYKKQGKREQAAALWQELLNRQPHDLTPFIELAKDYEHRKRDYRSALALTEEALLRRRRRFNSPASGDLSEPSLRRRLHRLKRKMGAEDTPIGIPFR